VRPAHPAWCGTSLVQGTPSPTSTTWMNEIQQGNIGLIQMRRLGSMGPLVQPLNRHNHHSEAILCVPKRRWCITRHRGAPAAPRGPAAPTNRRVGRNRPTTALGAVIRGIQGKRRWITGLAAPPDLAAPMILVPHAQPTFLAYKKHLTLTGLKTQHKSISISIFCSLRLGLV
jgi:hypothetical protein